MFVNLFKSKYKITQILSSYKWLIRSITWWYFLYLLKSLPWTISYLFILGIESLVILNVIRLEIQFQKSQNQFRKLILKILFL